MIIDTNVLILFSKGDQDVANVLLRSKETLYISRINYIEFLSDTKFTDTERTQARSFLRDNFTIVDVDEAIAEEAIRIRTDVAVKLPDAIVLATARLLNQTLYTLDTRLKKKFSSLIES